MLSHEGKNILRRVLDAARSAYDTDAPGACGAQVPFSSLDFGASELLLVNSLEASGFLGTDSGYVGFDDPVVWVTRNGCNALGIFPE